MTLRAHFLRRRTLTVNFCGKTVIIIINTFKGNRQECEKDWEKGAKFLFMFSFFTVMSGREGMKSDKIKDDVARLSLLILHNCVFIIC